MKDNYIKIANSVIDTEILGLHAVKDNFNDLFTDLIDNILNISGRVVMSGMGKSGHIAKKITASLASTGTASFFVHPSEASHGDLGMITKNDIVILLSNSGETKELGDIINYYKRFAIPLVALVRRKNSLLVDMADIAIILPEVPEASQVNAPTTSTTMMLAFGDALTVTLAELKGFSKEQFGVFHPGGKLGSNFKRVSHIMRKGQNIPIMKATDLMSNVIIEMSSKHIGSVAIIDNNKLVGVITDGDLRRHMGDELLGQTAQNVMCINPRTISSDKLAVEAVNLMTQNNITTIFVVDDDIIKGVIHIHDCFKEGLI